MTLTITISSTGYSLQLRETAASADVRRIHNEIG